MTDRLPFDDDDDEGVYLFVEVRDLLRFQVTNLSLSLLQFSFFCFPPPPPPPFCLSFSRSIFLVNKNSSCPQNALSQTYYYSFRKNYCGIIYSFCHRRLLFIILIAKDKRGVRSRNFLLSGG